MPNLTFTAIPLFLVWDKNCKLSEGLNFEIAKVVVLPSHTSPIPSQHLHIIQIERLLWIDKLNFVILDTKSIIK